MGHSGKGRAQGFDCFVVVKDVVALRQKLRPIVRQPGLAHLVLSDQNPQRQVEADGLLALHQGCTSLGAAENQ